MTICTFAAREEQSSGRAPGRLLGRALGAGDWLGLAATPTFAALALITGLFDGGPHEALCAAMPDAVPLSGMAFMYLLMSVFHTAPWLRLVARWRGGL